MKLHFESTGNTEGFRAGKPLDVRSISMAVDLMLFDGGEPQYYKQEDGSVILEIQNATDATRERVIVAVKSVCRWGDMRFKELEQ